MIIRGVCLKDVLWLLYDTKHKRTNKASVLTSIQWFWLSGTRELEILVNKGTEMIKWNQKYFSVFGALRIFGERYIDND